MRLLALVNAHALAHVSRPLEVARVLRERGHEVHFAGHGAYLPVAAQAGFGTTELPYVSAEEVRRATEAQDFGGMFPEAKLREWIDAERALCRAWQPDLLLTDHRSTARTTADLEGLPCVALTNVHMTRYRQRPFFTPRRGATRGLLDALLRPVEWLENRLEFALFDRVVFRHLHALRRAWGLPARRGQTVEEGHLTLLTDVPEFNPSTELPPHVAYVGPLTWNPRHPAPRCLAEGRVDPRKPLVYVTIGSQGLPDMLNALGGLARRGVQVLAATGRPLEAGFTPPEGVFLETFVDTAWIYGGAVKADVALCHGGNGTLYQALQAGVPVVGFANHAEQYHGLRRVEELGVGRGFRRQALAQHGPALLVAAVEEVLHEPRFAQRAEALARRLQTWQGAPQRAAHRVEQFAARALAATRQAPETTPLLVERLAS